MDSGLADDGGGDAGKVLTRFVWPHGGGSVLLSGSFNRWSEPVPMSPVEGCPRVFQVIRWLTPGYHQYKFLVDGNWRYDEHQLCAPSEYGIVNTVQVTANTNYNQAVNPGMLMELDNNGVRSLVSVSDGTLTGVIPRIPDSDLQVCRHRISAFLSACTVYELLPKSGKVVALDVDTPVKQAFHILYEQGIPLAPLWDATRGQFVGVLSALDFILILRELGNHGSNLTEEELDTHTISAWKEEKAYLNGQIDGNRAAFSRPLIHASPYDNLREVTLRILQSGVATVPIIYSSFEDGSFPQLLHLASLSGILKCVCRYFRHCASTLPILQFPICAIHVGTWVPKIGDTNRRPLAMLRPSAPLISALNLLIQAQVSSIPIVDDNDALLDIYCRSDITALAKDKVYTHINLNEMTVHQALRLGQNSFPSHDLKRQRCQMCLRSDALHEVMERLAEPVKPIKAQVGGLCFQTNRVVALACCPGPFVCVRRLIIVEAGSRRVEGIITLSDMLKFLLG